MSINQADEIITSPIRFHTIVVTGSSGLIGSEVVRLMSSHCEHIIGIDNNMRARYFPNEGDTEWNRLKLQKDIENLTLFESDVRNRNIILKLFAQYQPEVVVHCAAQPSHDLSGCMPYDDFDINAVGTLNLLEALRQTNERGAFVFTSTNKVYGDNPNQLRFKELDTRWEYADEDCFDGVNERMNLDCCMHSIFGASKVAADIMVQEYGRYFGMNTVSMRLGCVTGRAHSGAQLHGFLSYLVLCNLVGCKYRIYGYKGKQVRDNVHGRDVANAIYEWLKKPSTGDVFNIGGGRLNSVSILEAISLTENITGRQMVFKYVDQPRKGDHICYISNTDKFRNEHRGWSPTLSLEDIMNDLVTGWSERIAMLDTYCDFS